jgi:hypothetical protein
MYYVFEGQPGWSGFRIREVESYDEMIEWVLQYERAYEHLPTVYYGTKLEFEPAVTVKTWKIKGE